MTSPEWHRRDLLRSAAAGLIAAPACSPVRSPPRRPSADGLAPAIKRLRARVQAAVVSRAVTGLAAALAVDGQVVWEEGFGWADREAGAMATARTPFCLASVSKPFTAYAVLRLAQRGLVGLDKPLHGRFGRLPGLRRLPPDATPRLLGAHAAGLPSFFAMSTRGRDPAPPPLAPLLEAYGEAAYPVGATYEYSNLGYAALGRICERATGRPFAEIMRREVLGPLALSDSCFGDELGRRRGAAVRYDASQRRIEDYVTFTPPSGEVYASAHDLIRFALANLPGGRGAAALSDASLGELRRPVLRGSVSGASTFGWFLGRSTSGGAVLFKDGGQPGVSTVMCVSPGEGLAGVVLANRTDNGEFVLGVLEEMFQASAPAWRAPETLPVGTVGDFVPTPALEGVWRGRLATPEKAVGAEVDIGADASLRMRIGGLPEIDITQARSGDGFLLGSAYGRIPSSEALREGATTLRLKLGEVNGRLVGRVLAVADHSERLALLPYVLEFERGRARC